MSEFGRVLRELRAAKGLTQKQLGEMTTGVSASYVALLETGQRRPSVESVAALASALKCTPAERHGLVLARGGGTSRERESVLASPSDIRSAATSITSDAIQLEALIDRVRMVSDDLGAQWASTASSAFEDRVRDWEDHANRARASLRRIAEALDSYAEHLEALDEAVARSLSRDEAES